MTKEECIKKALEYNTKTEFHNKARKFYDYAKNNGFLAEAVMHMKNSYRKSKINKNDVLSLALTFNNRSEFKKTHPTLYRWVCQNHLQHEIFKHMNDCGNHYKRCIYTCEFSLQ